MNTLAKQIKVKEENRLKLLSEIYLTTNGSMSHRVDVKGIGKQINLTGDDFYDAYDYLKEHMLITPSGAGYISQLTTRGLQVIETINNDNNSAETQESITGKIFISHSTKDSKVVHEFIDHILILGLGIKREEIFCTSADGAGIKSGLDFKKAIKDELLNAKAVFQIITKNYKTSEVCLNEMGAAWALKSVVIPIIAPPFTYDVGFIHSNTQQLRLNEESDLINLYDDHKGTLFIENINTSNYLKQVKKFIELFSKFNEYGDIKKEAMFFYGEESKIYGKLETAIFGHPFSEKFEESNSYHRYYYIVTENPINVLSSDIMREEGDANITYFNITRIQISLTDSSKDIKDFVGKNVEVIGNFMGGHNQWHRTDVLLFGTSIKELK